MAGWLEGRVALITGASSGIGFAVAERFVAEGARVCVMARSADPLEELARAWPGQVVASPGDVRSLADNEASVRKALEAFGALDVFVGNAGIFDCFASLTALPAATMEAAFDEIFAVNVKALLLGTKAALPALRRPGAAIIFTASQAGLHPAGGGPIYTASKHAVVGLTRQLACELAPGVRVNAVAPGGTVSDVAGPAVLDEFCSARPTGQERAELIRHRNPLRRAQLPHDHAGAYVLLASNQSPAITGTVIESDGGVGVRGIPIYD